MGYIKKFTGNLLVVNAGKDTVIPRDVIDKLITSAENANSKQLITIEDSPHGIMRYMEINPTVMDEITSSISYMINLASSQ